MQAHHEPHRPAGNSACWHREELQLKITCTAHFSVLHQISSMSGSNSVWACSILKGVCLCVSWGLATKCCPLIIIASWSPPAPDRDPHWMYCALCSNTSCWCSPGCIHQSSLTLFQSFFCRKISAKQPQISPLLFAYIKLSAILKVTVKMRVYCLLAIKMLIWLCYKINQVLNKKKKSH